MRLKTDESKTIEEYLLKSPINRGESKPYFSASKALGVTEEKVRQVWRSIRKSGKVGDVYIVKHSNTEAAITSSSGDSISFKSVDEVNDTAKINKVVGFEVVTLQDLINTCKIDVNIWNIDSWECKRYNSWIKKDGEIYNEPRYSVSAKLSKRKIDTDLGKQKELLISEFKEIITSISPVTKLNPYNVKEGLLLELSAPDLHLGKLSWKDESGEDYDINIACQRYKEAIYNLAGRAPLDNIERILLPIGNDMITIDSRKNMTTAGTPQDSDSRFRKMLIVLRDLLIDVINTLITVAPVDVVVVSGNHDYDSMFTIGMVLEAFYSKNDNVSIDNSATQRKYYQFGKNGIQFTHGNEEKHQDLGLIFATERPQLWGETKFREVQLGHFHKNKKLSFLSADEHQGFQVQVLPSLSGTDAWHNSKGYNSLKQAKAFLYDKEEGKIAELTYTIK